MGTLLSLLIYDIPLLVFKHIPKQCFDSCPSPQQQTDANKTGWSGNIRWFSSQTLTFLCWCRLIFLPDRRKRATLNLQAGVASETKQTLPAVVIQQLLAAPHTYWPPFRFLCHLWKTKRDKGIISRTPHCSEEDFSRGKQPVNSEPFVSKKQIT